MRSLFKYYLIFSELIILSFWIIQKEYVRILGYTSLPLHLVYLKVQLYFSMLINDISYILHADFFIFDDDIKLFIHICYTNNTHHLQSDLPVGKLKHYCVLRCIINLTQVYYLYFLINKMYENSVLEFTLRS